MREKQKIRSGDRKRRELLIKLGKLAAYTPPALVILTLPGYTSANSFDGPPGPPGSESSDPRRRRD